MLRVTPKHSRLCSVSTHRRPACRLYKMAPISIWSLNYQTRDILAPEFGLGARKFYTDSSSSAHETYSARNVPRSAVRSKYLPMTYRARPFLAQWEFEHIKVVAPANREEHARLLAEKCRNDAAKVGINRWALEIVAGGDLIRSMIQALKEAEFSQTPAIS